MREPVSKIIDDLEPALKFAKELGINQRWLMKGTDRYLIQRLSKHLIALEAELQKLKKESE